MIAPLPATEAARVAALHALGILDTPAEHGFDDLVMIARQIAATPIALVSLVDAERQWFKARAGLEAEETPRSVAFCAHAILDGGVLVVPDARADDRFADNPLVTGPPYVRFYAGAPIMTADGHAIGTVCVIDSEPHADFAAAPALAALARQAGALMELRVAARAQAVLAGERDRLLATATHDLDRLWRMAHEVMIVTDLDLRLIAANPAWEALFGPLPANGAATPIDWHHPEEDHTPRGLQEGAADRFRRHYRDLEGVDRFISWTVTRSGDRLFGVGRDDTALIAAEDNLRHAQKMEAVGRLTGGIAHDFNNLLTIVIGNLDIAARRLGPEGDPRVARALAQAGEGASRAATLTQRLLAFARRQPLAPRALDPAAQLAAARPLIERAVGDTVTLEIGCDGDCWPVMADASQLESALLNLAVNARDAMTESAAGTRARSARLTIATANVMLGAAEIARRALASAAFVRFSVTDTGAGMPEEIVGRVFEPFFTTKPVGHGTGLGLSQVHGFVTQSDGFVTIDTAPGAGTTVHVWLPRAATIVREETAAAPSAAARPSRPTSVMVVEDNDAVRELLVTTLRDGGYRVIEAHDGAAGLALFRRQDPAPDLVVSDVQMPNLDGPALARAIIDARPQTQVLLITGFAEAAAAAGAYPLLMKPFTRHALLARVATLTAP